MAWEREIDPAITFFTIGVSTIGGVDIIKGADGDLSDIYTYVYTDESENVLSVEVERYFDEPIASFGRAVLDVVLDNNSGRYSPNSDSPISEYIKVNRPFISRMGFNYGQEELVPKFIGVNRAFPTVSKQDRAVTFQALDLADTIWNTPIEQSQLYLDTSVDQIIYSLLSTFGIPDDQIELDASELIIPAAYFEKGDSMGTAIAKLCMASQSVFYVDEDGTFRYRSRDWYAREQTDVVQVITDDIVIEEKDIDNNTITNIVEINSKPLALMPLQFLWQLPSTIEIGAGDTIEYFINYDDPVVDPVQPVANGDLSFLYANTDAGDNGLDISTDIEVLSWENFAKTSKITMRNNGIYYAYITDMQIFGQPVKVTQEIYVRQTDNDSIDEYGEHKLEPIDNDFIQSSVAARSFAQILLTDWSTPAAYKEMLVLGNPRFQLGDLVERDGETYNIIGILDRFTGNDGLVQRLKMVHREVATYFRIGISTIEGPDVIAP